ncbi:MAG TPA: hypothetical protein PKA82_15875 [Pyrinomonadaceae bacterium]|nr:hypothetical protein [Pyrinomonadaceae bacterium]
MHRLYACIISTTESDSLAAVAGGFAHAIEVIDGGILFDVSGLERLVGDSGEVAAKILGELERRNIDGSVAVAETADAAILLAREGVDKGRAIYDAGLFSQLPLASLELDRDTLGVFHDLGITKVEHLLAVPRDELMVRYGREFDAVIKRIEQRAGRLIVPNVAESEVSWSYELDQPVEDFEQLIFVINHGLGALFAQLARLAKSTDHLDISLRLANKRQSFHEIKTSFPTLERSFWLKLIDLRVSLNAPEAAIVAVKVTAHFTRQRADQRGLYAVSRPEPESLLLTANKLKKLVGEGNIGVPVILDQRIAEPFTLDAAKLPTGVESTLKQRSPVIAFNYFRPPHRADVVVKDRRIISIRTREISGEVVASSGVWRASSRWWERPWSVQEWDVEVAGHGVYRLSKRGGDWFITGEYD